MFLGVNMFLTLHAYRTHSNTLNWAEMSPGHSIFPVRFHVNFIFNVEMLILSFKIREDDLSQF